MTQPEMTPPAPSTAAKPHARVPMAKGVAITVRGVDEAVAAVTRRACERTGFTLFPLTFPALAAMRRDLRVQAAYRAATFVTAGTTPLAWLAGGERANVSRVSGGDLVSPLAEACVTHGLRLFLVGADDGAIARTGQRLTRETNGRIDVAGSLALAPGAVISAGEIDRLLARLRASGVHICLLELDSPRQELLATRLAARDAGIGFICLGDAFSGRG